eukprot:6187141-Pleurochrysis_carterae.AAC.4
MLSGVSQRGACRLLRKIGEANAPRSAGCSKANSAPAVCAARSRPAVRRTISLACSSRWCCAGTVGSPITLSLSRTGGGLPSAASLQRKKRDTENVEQGGEATMAA